MGLAHSFHGSTSGAGASTFIPSRRAGYGPTVPGSFAIPVPDCYRCPLALTFPSCEYACARVGFDLVDRQSVGSLAAVIAEPILGTAGCVEPPPGYLGELQRLARQREMLLIFDEAQTGLGRTGDLWGGDRDGVTPDLLTISKTLGGGIPLAATATTAAVEAQAYRAGFFFFTSHLNEPLPAAVGLAVLDVIADEKLVDAARDRGAYLKQGLLALKDRYEIVGDVRGRGLLMGVDFVDRSREQAARRRRGGGDHPRVPAPGTLPRRHPPARPLLGMAGGAAAHDHPRRDRSRARDHRGRDPRGGRPVSPAARPAYPPRKIRRTSAEWSRSSDRPSRMVRPDSRM